MWKPALIVAVVALLSASAAQAQLLDVRQTIYGMDWSICAHAVRVAVEKIEGVSSAEVSLNDGEVVVALDEDNHVRLDRLREVIRDQGFTPRGAEIRARGVVERRDGRLVFRTPEGEVVLDVIGEAGVMDAVEARVGERVVVYGHVEEEAGQIRVVDVVAGGATPSWLPLSRRSASSTFQS